MKHIHQRENGVIMLQKFSKGHWPIFFLSSFSSLGNLFLPLVLVRLLSTEEIGFYKIFFLHLAAIPFIVMAGGPINSVYYWAGKDSEEKREQLNATWTLTVLLSSLVLIIGLPMRSYLSSALGLPVHFVDVLLLIGFLTCPSSHFSETTIANGKSLNGSLYSTLGEVLKAIGFIVIATRTHNLYWVVLFYAGLLATKLVVGTYLNKKINQISFVLNVKTMKKALDYCLPVAVTGLLGFFIDKIDLLILSGKLDADSFAYYSLGCLVIPPLYLIEMSVQKTLIPKISRFYLEKDFTAGARQFRKGMADIAILIIPSIFGLFTFAAPIVTLIYTDKFAESVPYLQIFAFSYLLAIFPHDSVPRATGRTGWILKVYCVISAISLPAVYFATGLVNTKMVLVISIALKFIPKFWGLKFSKDIMNWSWKEMFPVRKLALYTMLAGSLSVSSVLIKNYFKNEVTWFLVCGSMFAAIYLGLLFILPKLGRSEVLADAT